MILAPTLVPVAAPAAAALLVRIAVLAPALMMPAELVLAMLTPAVLVPAVLIIAVLAEETRQHNLALVATPAPAATQALAATPEAARTIRAIVLTWIPAMLYPRMLKPSTVVLPVVPFCRLGRLFLRPLSSRLWL